MQPITIVSMSKEKKRKKKERIEKVETIPKFSIPNSLIFTSHFSISSFLHFFISHLIVHSVPDVGFYTTNLVDIVLYDRLASTQKDSDT